MTPTKKTNPVKLPNADRIPHRVAVTDKEIDAIASLAMSGSGGKKKAEAWYDRRRAANAAKESGR